VARDLSDTKQLLDAGDAAAAAERERADSDKRRRAEDVEESTRHLEDAKRSLHDRQAALEEARSRLAAAEEENETLVEQMRKMLLRVEVLEQDNARTRSDAEDALAAAEEARALEEQKTARLESFAAEYEEEISALSTQREELREQIMALEDRNGRLQGEVALNDGLRGQMEQLQRDLRSDTDLRQELVRDIERAKSALGEEVRQLETALADERRRHAETRTERYRLEKALAAGDKVAEEQATAAKREINRLAAALSRTTEAERDKRSEPSASPTLESASRIRQLERLLDESTRSLAVTEDHANTLRFSLSQREAELEEARSLFLAATCRHEAAAERARETQEALRVELREATRAADILAEERNGYRAQTLQMNLALRNGLEHIKLLRGKVGQHGQAEPSASSPCASARPELGGLQSCLASLRAEMAVLQSRLAPASPSHRPASASSETVTAPIEASNQTSSQEEEKL